MADVLDLTLENLSDQLDSVHVIFDKGVVDGNNYTLRRSTLGDLKSMFVEPDDSNYSKLQYISVTQVVDLDAIESRVNELDQSVVLQGTWDASAGTFPGSGAADAGHSWIVSVAGTVDSIDFQVGDRIIAIVDNASTATYANNWLHLDYTDKVSSVFGRTGIVTAQSGDYNADQITETATNKILTSLERSKLAGIEDNATADQTGSEIESLLDTQLGHSYWSLDWTQDQGSIQIDINNIPDLSSLYSIVGHNHNGVYSPVGHSHVIGDITDIVLDSTLADGHALFYDGSSDTWINRAITEADISDLVHYTDSDADSRPGYNNTNWDTAYGWGDHAGAGYLTNITGEGIGDLLDVSVSSGLADGDMLLYNASAGVFENVPYDPTVAIANITDIVLDSTLADGHILTYDGSSNTWINMANTGGMSDLIDDTTPQLGGPLDVNGQEIQSSGNVVFQLGDNAGANKLSIQDSDSAEVFNIDSDGRIAIQDGTTALPGISFVSDPDTGFRRSASNEIRAVFGGSDQFYFNSNYLHVKPTSFQLGGAGGNVKLYFETDGILEQYRTTTAQEFRIYNTRTDSSNYERLSIRADSDSHIYFDLQEAGTGDVGSFYFQKLGNNILSFQVNAIIVYKSIVPNAVSTNLGSSTARYKDIWFYQSLNQKTSSTSDPSASEYGTDQDWGMHENTTTGDIFLAINNAGSILKTRMVSDVDILQMRDKSADPSDPANGSHVLWQSDGTASGDDGDIMLKITDSGGTTKTVTLYDYSANQIGSGGGSSTLDGLTDTALDSSLADGDLLVYDGSSATWINTPSSSFGGLSNVVEDTTPELGGNLAGGGFNLTNLKNLDIAQGTITDPEEAINISTTWNDVNDVFKAFIIDVTDTSSDQTSSFARFVLDSSDAFDFTKRGVFQIYDRYNAVASGESVAGLEFKAVNSGSSSYTSISSINNHTLRVGTSSFNENKLLLQSGFSGIEADVNFSSSSSDLIGFLIDTHSAGDSAGAGTKLFRVLYNSSERFSVLKDGSLYSTGALATLGNFVFNIDQTVGAGQDNYVLTYDNSSGLISLEAATGGASDFASLSDVVLTSGLADGDLLMYEASSATWINFAHTFLSLGIAGEINSTTSKSTPVANDEFLIEDSAASYIKKSLSFADLEGALNHDSLAGFVTEEHINWTTDVSGSYTINPNNVPGVLTQQQVSVSSSRNIAATDKGKLIRVDTTSADVTLTFETGLAADFICYIQRSAGDNDIILAEGSGVTINGTAVISADKDPVTVYHESTDNFDIWNNEPLVLTISTETGTSRTATLADNAGIVEMNNASANTFTIPADSTEDLPIGFSVTIRQMGAGTTTIDEESGVTVASKNGQVLDGQGAVATIYKRGPDNWAIIGDTTA